MIVIPSLLTQLPKAANEQHSQRLALTFAGQALKQHSEHHHNLRLCQAARALLAAAQQALDHASHPDTTDLVRAWRDFFAAYLDQGDPLGAVVILAVDAYNRQGSSRPRSAAPRP